MLTAEQMATNQTKFQETNQKYGIFTPELEKFLGDSFYTSPASTTIELGGCYPGGLLNVTMKACKYIIGINELLPKNIKQDKNTIVRVSFLSQIGRCFLFVNNDNEWQRKTLGKMYDYNPDIIKLKTGERAIYYAMSNGVKLNDLEFQCIINLDKDSDDKQAKYFSEPLTQIVKQGFELAFTEEKSYGKKGN